jgi:hypothetical protein
LTAWQIKSRSLTGKSLLEEETIMSRPSIIPILMFSAILLAILACDLPGTTPDLAAQYYPSHTAAVRTLQAMETEHAQYLTEAALNPQASSPDGTPAPSGGTSFTANPDGSATLTDFDAGFEVTAPAGWISVRPASEEYDAALESTAKDEDMQRLLTGITDYDPQEYRLFSFSQKPNHLAFGYIPEISINWDAAADSFIEDELRTSIRKLETDPEFPGLRVISSQISNTETNKVAVGVIGANWTARNDKGDSLPIYLKAAVFNSRTGMVVLLMITIKDSRDQVEPDFDQMVETIKVLK